MNELKFLYIFVRIFLRQNSCIKFQNLPPHLILMILTPIPQKEIFKQSFIYSWPVIWNNLPDWLKNSDNFDSFHNQCIKWMKRLTSCS